MQTKLMMAVDLGTSFIKVGVYDTQGNCLVITSEPVKEHCPKPGIYIQYGDEIFTSVLASINSAAAELGERSGNVEAISFTGQMAGFMGVDKDWNDITTWSCSLDGRYLPFIDRMMQEHADLFLEEAGTNSPVMAPKIKWFEHDFPEESKKIAKYCMISSYVLGRLGAVPIEEASINRSYLEWTGLSDIRNDKWSEKVCSALSIDKNTLPKIVQSYDICGHLSAEMAGKIGLKSGIPLISGCGDKPAGCLGAAVVEPGEVILEAASYAGMSCCVESYKPDYDSRRVDLIPSAIPGEFYMHNFLAGSGITLKWFIDNFAADTGQPSEAFRIIENNIAGIEPGSDGLLAIGMLGGRAMPFDGNIRGMWMNFNWTHKKEHFYRALLESYSYEFALTLDTLDKLYTEYAFNNVKIIGGGAKSVIWNQMNADVCRRTFSTLNRSDVALWGASIIAGKAVGIFDDMKKTAREHVKVLKDYKPDPDMYTKYEKFMKTYAQYIVSLSGHFKNLNK